MKVKFLKNWRTAKKGEVLSLADINAKYCVDSKIAEVVKKEKKTKENKVLKTK